MAQSLLIGLGGTGSRVVNYVAHTLRENGKQINDGNGEIYCAVLDTNENDTEAILSSGTNIPVIGTSRNQPIRDYVREYMAHGIRDWCPESAAFYKSNMKNGAAEMRVKSRIAFMDCTKANGRLDALKNVINDMLIHNHDSEIRVMVVSSLSGGTGAGMFIQTALWLREHLANRTVNIRGIFLLPDIFVQTLPNIGDSASKRTRHYANAYAAIRELNALTVIRRDEMDITTEPIKLDELFDSKEILRVAEEKKKNKKNNSALDEDKEGGAPIYDTAFFIDYKDKRGSHLSSSLAYEQSVAQLIYMQLYSPMNDQMKSEEDNNFSHTTIRGVPVYGSCGAAKVVYSMKSVMEYSVLRAMQQSLTTGWTRIDDEIVALENIEKMRAKDNPDYEPQLFDKRIHYTQIFETKISVDKSEVGKNRFFAELRDDIYNESLTIDHKTGKINSKKSSKIKDFTDMLNQHVFDPQIATRFTWDGVKILDSKKFVKAKNTVETLREKVTTDENSLRDELTRFNDDLEKISGAIADRIFPCSMGSVKINNNSTLYGMLAKKDEEDRWHFIHPVAVRYLLYKVYNYMAEFLRKNPDTQVDELFKVNDPQIHLDNPNTEEIEETPLEYLMAGKSWWQTKGQYLDQFEEEYVKYINTVVDACRLYELNSLKKKVFIKLKERLDIMLRKMEDFFAQMGEIQEKIEEDLQENIDLTAATAGRISYILGDEDSKERLYKTLNMNLEKGDVKINRAVVDTLYGHVCATYYPSDPDNKAYVGAELKDMFLNGMKESFFDQLQSDSANICKLDLNIYDAICKQGEWDEERSNKQKTEAGARNSATLKKVIGMLKENAVPMLQHEKEFPESELGIIQGMRYVFWGIHPEVADTNVDWSSVLGVNVAIAKNEGHPKNELACYVAEYGIESRYLPKFNELKAGAPDHYYTCYKHLITKMERNAVDEDGEPNPATYVNTVHLDKTWHYLLPYVTNEMQEEMNVRFGRGFWLAIAYGMIKVVKDKVTKKNVYILQRQRHVGGGDTIPHDTVICLNNEPVEIVNIEDLLEALRRDIIFNEDDIAELEDKFEKDIEGVIQHTRTKVFKGLTQKENTDLNPAVIIKRYAEKRGVGKKKASVLLSRLEGILNDIADNYKDTSSNSSREKKLNGMREAIYNAGGLKNVPELFEEWVANFPKKATKKSVKGATADTTEDAE